MKEIRASQKETDRQIQKIGGRFNQRFWGALVESLVEGKLVRIFQNRLNNKTDFLGVMS